jgi:hypothetical protein
MVTKKCQRCHKEITAWTMSYFNTQIICLDCMQKERKRPDYHLAIKTEQGHVKKGNYNFVLES